MYDDDSYTETIVNRAFETLSTMAYFNCGHYPRLEMTTQAFIMAYQRHYDIDLHADIDKLMEQVTARPSEADIKQAMIELANYRIDFKAFYRRTIERTEHFDCWNVEDIDTVVLVEPCDDTITLLKELQGMLVELHGAGFIDLPRAFSNKPEIY